ncbi:hypothetical protein MKX01_042469 [Papaver californicum]|nr:hypothetical protein MKX01_042469 [Papaver californicum]
MNFEQSCNEYSSISSSSQPSSSTDQNCSSESDYTSSSSSSLLQLVSHKKTSGRKKFKETRHPIYRGVRARKNGKWVCEVREPNSKSRIWLGTHSSAEMAARAYDVAAVALRGKSAPLNFEDSLWLLPRAKSSSAKDIQFAVAEASRTISFPTCTKSSSRIPKKSPKSVISKLSKRPVETAEKIFDSLPTTATFFDEEALYNMPALIASMAEGMLLDPPHDCYYFDDVEYNVDRSLWSE